MYKRQEKRKLERQIKKEQNFLKRKNQCTAISGNKLIHLKKKIKTKAISDCSDVAASASTSCSVIKPDSGAEAIPNQSQETLAQVLGMCFVCTGTVKRDYICSMCDKFFHYKLSLIHI